MSIKSLQGRRTLSYKDEGKGKGLDTCYSTMYMR